ncbi:hypothetical protein SNK05_013085 [Fusarium graminearum]
MSQSQQSLLNGNTNGYANGHANGRTSGPEWDAKIQKLNGELREAKYLAGFHGDALIGVSHHGMADTHTLTLNRI